MIITSSMALNGHFPDEQMNTNIKAIERQRHWPISKTNESGSGFETFMIIHTLYKRMRNKD